MDYTDLSTSLHNTMTQMHHPRLECSSCTCPHANLKTYSFVCKLQYILSVNLANITNPYKRPLHNTYVSITHTACNTFNLKTCTTQNSSDRQHLVSKSVAMCSISTRNSLPLSPHILPSLLISLLISLSNHEYITKHSLPKLKSQEIKRQ